MVCPRLLNNVSIMNLNNPLLILPKRSFGFRATGGFRPVIDGNSGTRNTPPLFFSPHLASHLSSQFSPPLFPALKGFPGFCSCCPIKPMTSLGSSLLTSGDGTQMSPGGDQRSSECRGASEKSSGTFRRSAAELTACRELSAGRRPRRIKLSAAAALDAASVTEEARGAGYRCCHN
ncbi:hypothetical protein NQ317_012723 [Molorchus minor]|uniref:Uncharacterized protein n=1 Tax=Molorchus minor TaxID=1323400 RepID=A0ABQ9JNR9_9CUCU|nr:hypothetical protein NQ317_012723 [Molorchus minor]